MTRTGAARKPFRLSADGKTADATLAAAGAD